MFTASQADLGVEYCSGGEVGGTWSPASPFPGGSIGLPKVSRSVVRNGMKLTSNLGESAV